MFILQLGLFTRILCNHVTFQPFRTMNLSYFFFFSQFLNVEREKNNQYFYIANRLSDLVFYHEVKTEMLIRSIT